MNKIYRRYLTPVIILGAVMIITQILFAYTTIFMNFDRTLTTTATSLLASTNREIMLNLEDRFDRMIKIASHISIDENFKAYDRTESKLPPAEIAATELSLGHSIANYTSMDDFCDCALVYKDGSYLGQLDSHTAELYPGETLYKEFSDLKETDTQNFFTGYNDDFSRVYFAKAVNPGTIVLVSILQDSLNTIFYDAEDNYNLTLHLTTPDNRIIYSGNKDEMLNGVMNTDLTQAVENLEHAAIEVHGQVISTDVCKNGFRITSNIPQTALTQEKSSHRTIYLIISGTVIIASICMLVFLSIHIKKKVKEIDELEETLDDFSDIDKINIS
ncbi:MAG: hypothetical protein J6P16_03365 [Eubacterium sp.]|nr:hypothetical protein [Eubacterium sp.]